MDLFGARHEIDCGGPWAAVAPRWIRCGPVAALLAGAILAGASAIPAPAPGAVASLGVAPSVVEVGPQVVSSDARGLPRPRRPSAPPRTAHYTPATPGPEARPGAAADAPVRPDLAR